jgi:hypothetical protein
MEENSERLGPRSDPGSQTQAPGDAGEAGVWDAEDDAGVVTSDPGKDADMETWADADAEAEAREEADADVEVWGEADAEAEAREETDANGDVWGEADADAEVGGEAEADVGDWGEGGAGAEAQEEEYAGSVVWDVDQEPGPVAWEAGETAGGAVPVPDAPERWPATGEPRVDAALARLDELAGRPVTEHRAVFEDVHRRLRDVLGELDSREQDQVPAGGAERRAGR